MYKSEYDILLEKLDEFIRKYYKNEIIKGGLYSSGILLAFYLAITLLEYFGHFNSPIRTIIFYLFVIFNGGILIKLIAIPIFRLNKMGEFISNEKASEIIGKHFSNVQDKLLNIIQLKHQHFSFHSSALVEASINQKINDLKPIPFSSAIDFKQNRIYLKYALVPLLLFFVVYFINSRIITESTKRLIKHNSYFEIKAPFQFSIQNKELRTPQNDDFLLLLKIDGQEIPQDVFVNLNGEEYKLTKANKNEFSFLFRNVQHNIPFQLSADGFLSKQYNLVTVPKPILLDFFLKLSYPKYIGKNNEILRNSGDLLIPEGTKATWVFTTKDTRQIKLSFVDTTFIIQPSQENRFVASQSFYKDKTYSISTSNEFLQNRDSVTYSVNVIPDAEPFIEVQEQKDSVSTKQIYFTGNVKDDYGFNRLNFIYHFTTHIDSSKNRLTSSQIQTIAIPIAKNTTQEPFYYFWDLANVAVLPGDEIEYYFEIWDNDGIHGSKSTRSHSMIYHAPSIAELEKNTEKNNEELKKEMKESVVQAKELQKKTNELYKKILEKKTLSWEEKKKLEDLLKQQKELEQTINQIKKENEQNVQKQAEFQKPNDLLAEKQKQLQQLMDQVMSDEMKTMFQEMQKMMENLDKNKVQEMLEKMQLSNKDVEKELDRNLEVFKKMEFEQKLDKVLNQLNQLSKKQDDLADKSLEKNADSRDQDSLNKKFDDLKKDLSDLEKKNRELDKPEGMPDTQQKQEEIEKDMKNSSEDLSKGKSKSASKSQKSASQKMNQLAQQMQEIQNQQGSQQDEEDENALRDILNNLLQLSFDQEALMNDVEKIKPDNPQYVKLSQQQKKLKDDSQMIEDSLFAISKRQPNITSTVNREIAAINSNIQKVISFMGKREARFTPDIASKQQFTMTSINNLALMINESLSQMQNNCKKSGSCSKPGTCKKPGHGEKPSSGNMSKMQEGLKKQMEALMKSMKEGKKQGGTKGNGSWGMELVKIAAQQEVLKNMMQQLKNEEGINPGELKNMLKMMEESQKDVVNNMLSDETLKRQSQMLEKLLDYEKAEKERNIEKKRKAEEAKKDDFKRNFASLMEYNNRKGREIELLKTVPPSFKMYYKNKVVEYFNNYSNQ